MSATDAEGRAAHARSQLAQVQAFLEALTELSRRTGITIEGCGCCGSPALALDGAFNPHAADVGNEPDAVRAEVARAGWYIVVRETETEDPEEQGCRFQDLTWRPQATIFRNDSRPGLDGAPSVLPSIDELEGIEHALLAPHRHQFTDAEIAELETEHDLADLDVTSALEHAYRQQDPEGHTRTWEWDDPDPDTSGSDAELEARVADAEATLKASPKDYVARCLRIALLAELTRRRRWRARDEATHPHSEAAGENRCGP